MPWSQFASRRQRGNFSVAEDALTATITVHRVGGAQGEAAVEYTTSDGTAFGEVDYFPASGTLTFAEGVTSRTFTVTIENDDAPEAPETFLVALSNPAGGADLGQPADSVVTLLDNDLPAGPNVRHYVAAKGQAFLQTGAAAPAANPEGPFRFGAWPTGMWPTTLMVFTSTTVMLLSPAAAMYPNLPSGVTYTLCTAPVTARSSRSSWLPCR